MSGRCFGCGWSLDTANVCTNIKCASNSFPFKKTEDWISKSYIKLGACRDNMKPSEVEIVQKFIEGGYSD